MGLGTGEAGEAAGLRALLCLLIGVAGSAMGGGGCESKETRVDAFLGTPIDLGEVGDGVWFASDVEVEVGRGFFALPPPPPPPPPPLAPRGAGMGAGA